METKSDKLENRPLFKGKNLRPMQGPWEGVFALRTAKLDHRKPKNLAHELVNRITCMFRSTPRCKGEKVGRAQLRCASTFAP